MKALVTGGAGFVGSHLVDHLLALQHRVTVVDDLSTGRAANLAAAQASPACEVVEASVLDEGAMRVLVNEVDVVFHLAAAVGVHRIVDDPIRSLHTNLEGTRVMLEAARASGASFVLTSTSEVYGKNTANRLTEDSDRLLGSPLKCRWSYAEAKALDEMLTYTFHRDSGLSAVIVRLFNTVGPRQSGRYGMVIPGSRHRPCAGSRWWCTETAASVAASATWATSWAESCPSRRIPEPPVRCSTSAAPRRSRSVSSLAA